MEALSIIAHSLYVNICIGRRARPSCLSLSTPAFLRHIFGFPSSNILPAIRSPPPLPYPRWWLHPLRHSLFLLWSAHDPYRHIPVSTHFLQPLCRSQMRCGEIGPRVRDGGMTRSFMCEFCAKPMPDGGGLYTSPIHLVVSPSSRDPSGQ